MCMKKLFLLCTLVGIVFAQQPSKKPAPAPLKEYSYPSDGFAMKFPYAPDPHPDSIHSDFKVWTAHLEGDAGISLRGKVDSLPSNDGLERLKAMAKADNLPIREFSVSGRPAWEEQQHRSGNSVVLERYVCGVGRYYILTFGWPASGSRPQAGMEIMDSFRLIK